MTDNRNPAAWLAVAADGSESSAVYALKEQADAAAQEWDWMVVPLYRQPQPTLTAEEREAIEWAAEMIPAMAHPSSCSAHIHAAALRALLERTK